jgi:hypothetical protein
MLEEIVKLTLQMAPGQLLPVIWSPGEIGVLPSLELENLKPMMRVGFTEGSQSCASTNVSVPADPRVIEAGKTVMPSMPHPTMAAFT